MDKEEQSAEQFVRRIALGTLEEPDLERIEFRGRVGDVADEILAEVERIDPRYLVIGGHRRSSTGKALFGDTA